MTDPWAFGWTQLLTIVGFAITVTIAVGGFRSFNRWKREKIEESKIAVALEALAMSYEAKYVFSAIRSPMVWSYEWADMPEQPGELFNRRSNRGSYYAIGQRLQSHRDFFERLFRLQPRFMAVFGPTTESTFMLVHKARREIEVAVDMLARDAIRPGDYGSQGTEDLYLKLKGLLAEGSTPENGDEITDRIGQFQTDIESLCRPIVDRSYKANRGQPRWYTKYRRRLQWPT